MIRYTNGNLLDAPAEALVNTVNEVGVMGKGVALTFPAAFPDSARTYQEAAKRGDVHVGRVMVTRNEALVGPRSIIPLPDQEALAPSVPAGVGRPRTGSWASKS